MSRIAKKPVELISGVEVNISGQTVTAKGKVGNLSIDLHDTVSVKQEDNVLTFAPNDDSKGSMAMAGTMRSLVNNMVVGVSEGFTKQLQLVGVGYRAQMQGKVLDLSLGFSHPVKYAIPEGITIETPSQTEINVKGADKQKVGQVCAEIRAYRPPEPYKGKGVRYSDERVIRKEAKKK
ncbi:LSU ribosomal protein L6p (L9e) [hydrothermal vent metagenome]|uniref:LSU ribosomal protein L6p (L9e) n=1 Tax=hydrothermal vent metagenome TaxID=652676 RepID=A0A3B0W7Y2_9ZZZZ